jgi:hypothetical protein
MRRWIALILGLAAAATLAVVVWPRNAQGPVILAVHGGKVSAVGAAGDIADASEATLLPNGKGLAVATGIGDRQLVLAEWADPASPKSGLVNRRPLPLPEIRSPFPVSWQWSFSPDGKYLAVNRQMDWSRVGAFHGMTPEQEAGAKEICWVGAVDLETWKAVPFDRTPPADPRERFDWRIVGWQGQDCLICLRELYRSNELILAFSAANPAAPREVLTGAFNGILGVSPDGKKIGVYYGGEKDVPNRLHNFETGSVTLLISTPASRAYSEYGQAEVVFSHDSRYMAVQRHQFKDGLWHINTALEAVDSGAAAYTDEFTRSNDHSAADERMKCIPVWSRAGPERFAYFRLSEEEKDNAVVIVGLEGDLCRGRRVPLEKRLLADGWIPQPIWSPSGDEVAWVYADRQVVVYDIAQGKCRPVGTLPEKTMSWSWACPAVLQPSPH